MNGITTVTIKVREAVEIDGQRSEQDVDKVFDLKFGMQAVAALEERQKKSGLEITSTEGYIKFLSDLFYCGVYGNSVRKDIAIIPYTECMDLFEILSMQPDAADQFSKMTNCYFESIKEIQEKKAVLATDTDKKKVM